MERKLFWDTWQGDEVKVKEILRSDPGVDIGWRNDEGWTALHRACDNGHDTVASILLAHPDINVNRETNIGYTPFLLACFEGKTSCARLLLKDLRVEVGVDQKKMPQRFSPLLCAAHKGHLDIIKWWIASGREMDLGTPGNRQTDAIGEAEKKGETEVVTLLKRFKGDAAKTRSEVRKELGIIGQYSYCYCYDYYYFHYHAIPFLSFSVHDLLHFLPPTIFSLSI